MAKFDMKSFAETLGMVPESGTKQIEYVDIDLLHEDPRNFYEVSGVDELASNIALFGLMDPLLVRNAEDGTVQIVSGHRRHAALRKLVEEGHEDLRQVPCIKVQGESSPALQELRLIYANSDTRKMTNADIGKQAERVEQLLYQLKEEGHEFPGRMRDHVAEACKISKSKLSRLKVIRENLTPKLKKTWEQGKLNESAAYAFAQNPIEVQDKAFLLLSNREWSPKPEHWNERSVKDATGYASKLSKLGCKECGGKCTNQEPMLLALAGGSVWNRACREGKCCSTCSELISCKKACPMMAEKVKKLRADRKAQRDHDAEVQAELDRPTINRIKAYWMRFGEARASADISVKSWHKAMEMYYRGADGKVDAEYMKKEAGEKIKRDTTLPYGYNFYCSDADRLCKAADRLGCSIDYLLCRTDDPSGRTGKSSVVMWQTGTPPTDGLYYVKLWLGDGFVIREVLWYDNVLEEFSFHGNRAKVEGEVIGWYPLPCEFLNGEVEEDEELS